MTTGQVLEITGNALLVLILLSSVSVQIMVGLRVCYAMAKDGVIFRSLERISKKYQVVVKKL
jgi:amino acid transporter